ncbi:leucine-rich repeat extensin-like protein 5 [Macadamia integrifolia]|uniref:leucine-rich repeat extensin-like protein 5 n=1 Tax=Macadamia integrifolia TaxID=60698 RepID=UPI001C4F1F73|nr:leucine-rich repeat extensin-like protein 5 [Macadamia integrifolia]
MGHGRSMVSIRREWFSWLLWIELLFVIMFSQVAMGDEIGIPATGLLCISECSTCPTICSPPPASASLPPPPPPPSSPPPQHSPPQSNYFPQSPPPKPPPHSLSSYSAPPPSYSTVSSRPPPSPLSYFTNTPTAQSPPTINGPLNDSYPYYYFYASEAASFSLPAIFSYFVTSLLCSSLVFPFW